jgi:hypothetical protein
MKPIASLALLLSLAVAGCAGGGTASHAVTTSASSKSKIKLKPYALPIVTSRAVQAAGNRANSRSTQDAIGQIPTLLQYLLSISLTDASLEGATQINLALLGVNALNGTVATPIVSYNSDVIVNILSYQSSALDLGGAQVPAQPYTGIQLVIDPTQSTVVDAAGVTHPLTFGTMVGGSFVQSNASIQQISYPLAFDMSAGNLGLVLDFNAEQSILVSGGSYELAPNLAGTTIANAVSIAGNVTSATGAPVQGATAVVTTPDGTLVSVAPSDQNGNFQVNAIPAGTYVVTIQNQYTTATGMQVSASDGSTGSMAPIQVDIPAGYEIDLGQISD